MNTNITVLSGWLEGDAAVNGDIAHFVLCTDIWCGHNETMKTPVELSGKSVPYIGKYLKKDKQVLVTGNLVPIDEGILLRTRTVELFGTKTGADNPQGRPGGYGGRYSRNTQRSEDATF